MGEKQQAPGLNINAKAANTYDAIVIGSGISGGWAAKELTEKGLKTLLLERGRDVKHIRDYPTANMSSWEFKHHLEVPLSEREENPIQSQIYNEGNKHFFVNDKQHPYLQDKPFNWFRGYQVGGRSLLWGRLCFRLSDLDFEANAKDGIAVDWPIRYNDIKPWYDYVERFVGVSGQCEGLNHLPDGEFLPPMEMNFMEQHFKNVIREKYKDRLVTIGRIANLTKGWNGRGPCQYRNLCTRGCPFGGYFSSNSGTLPVAMATGNLTLRPHSVVSEILYDKKKRRAIGVRIIDAETKESIEYFARIIFLNASTIASTAILLNSVSDAFPAGLGNTSMQVGHNLMDHHFRVGAEGEHEDFKDQYYVGRRPNCVYIPRFRNLPGQPGSKNYIRGFGYQADAERRTWFDTVKHTDGFGESFKEKLTSPGPWTMWMGAWGETLPYYDNRVTLDDTARDAWGLPLVRINFEFKENEQRMREDMRVSAAEMLSAAGFKNINSFDYHSVGGDCVHEMGTARMGRDPKTSVLNEWNQMHDVPNVYITDGSCMTSSACQNPSLTYMALTARACDHAVSALKKKEL